MRLLAIFSLPNLKKKSELEAICIALDKSSRGTKKELVARILKEKRRLLRKSRR